MTAPESKVAAPVGGVDWYERRDELREGMVFNTAEGLVKLAGTVPGDGTKWFVADSYGPDAWCYEGSTVEPGDLIGEPITGAAS